jgi:hypothetical protein
MMEAPTHFVRNWVVQNYDAELCAARVAVAAVQPMVKRVEVRVKKSRRQAAG